MSVSGWSSDNGATMVQLDSLGQSNQVFNVEWVSTGYKLLPSYNPKVVSIHANSTANGADVEQYTDSEQLNQRFSIIFVSSGYYKIVAKSSGKCLAVSDNCTTNGASIVQWEWLNGYGNFKWKFSSVSLSSPISNGTYTVKAKHSNKLMSIDGWSSSDGAIVMQWGNVCQSNQEFDLAFTGSGYTLNPVYTDKVISIDSYSITNGAAVIQWENLSQQNQFFEIVDLGSGDYKIVSRFTNKCLAVNDNDTANGAHIVQWEWLDGYDNFKWSFDTTCSSPLARRITSNVERQAGPSVNISPNPANNSIRVDIAGINNAQIQIFDINGKLRLTSKAINNPMIICVNRYLGTGMHLLKITGTNISVTKKLIIQ